MSCRRRYLAVSILTGALLAAVPASAQLLSPGPLHRTHADLEGDNNCTRCHTSGKKVEAAKCFDCHDDLAKRIRARAGLHGRAYRGKPCAECHVEHIGRNSRLIRWPNGDKNNLDHALTGWPLKGEHRTVECGKCHNKTNRRGAATYLGLSTDCTSCHQDPHQGRFGFGCIDCHNETGWKRVRLDGFDHDLARFKLRGKHRSVDCEKCHGKPARYIDLKFDRCDDCHEDPHNGRFQKRCESCHVVADWKQVEAVRKDHPGLRLVNGHKAVKCAACHDRGSDRIPSQGRRCVSCHPPVHRADFGRNCKSCHRSIKWVGLPERIGRREHPKTRFPLRGRHQGVACAECHPPNVSPAQRYRELVFDRCDRCHQDPHKGAFADRNQGECALCHNESGFRPTLFGVELHATTRFALTGRHQATPCASCHKSPRPRLSLRLEQKQCADCHDNPHGNQFAAEMELGGCAHCHSTERWQNPKVDHSIWPLTGAHKQARCSACHTPSKEDRAAMRGPTYRGLPRECVGCHEDNHAGQFRLTEPARACEVCHVTASFRIAAFDHAGIAQYPLVGRHQTLACAKCHSTERLQNGRTVVRYRLGYRKCRDCHANPHRE